MMENTIWEIEGHSFELDMTDADTAERYETAAEKLREDIPEITAAQMQYSAFIRVYCKAYRDMYDRIFGEPVSEKIFAGIPDNIRKYNAVYAKFLAFVSAQKTAVNTEMDEISQKYMPSGKTE